jgi:ribosomal protein S18 acetylase RimI-like enzyme
MKNAAKKTTSSKSLKVTCRFMGKADVRGVAKVHAEAFDYEPSRALESVKEHSGHDKENGAVVAVVGKTIVGYALFTIQGTDMYIANVGVRRQNRGQGVCGRMIPWLLRRIACFGCDTASLIAVSDTDAAVRCYKSHGFEGDSSSLTYTPSKKRGCPKSTSATYTCADGTCH